MKWNLKRDIFPLCVLVLFGAMAVYFYSVLPEYVPIHFDASGTPDGFSSKSFLVWLNIGIAVLIYFLLTFIPFIDPFWNKIQKRYHIFLIFRDLALVSLLYLFLVTLLSAQQGRFQKDMYGVGLGMLFVLVGNYLPKLPRNFFFGIRSPWTLASDVVWKKTHLLSGWLFVLAGVIVALMSLLGVGLEIVLPATLGPLILITAIVYPLYLYKKLKKEEKTALPEL